MGLSRHCQNGSAFLLESKMKSQQQWSINGDIISFYEHDNHIKLYIKGTLSNPVFSRKFKIDCIIPERFYKDKPIDYTKPFSAKGRIIFEDKKCLFLVEQL